MVLKASKLQCDSLSQLGKQRHEALGGLLAPRIHTLANAGEHAGEDKRVTIMSEVVHLAGLLGKH